MKLIDADKVLTQICKICKLNGVDGVPKQAVQGVILALSAIDTMPAIKAVPVKHARWKHVAGMNSKCEACGNYFPVGEFKTRPFDVNFCIWCGAKMEGGNNDG